MSYDAEIDEIARLGPTGHYSEDGGPEEPLSLELVDFTKKVAAILPPGLDPFWDGNCISFWAAKRAPDGKSDIYYIDVGPSLEGISTYTRIGDQEWNFTVPGVDELLAQYPDFLPAIRQALS